MNADGYDVCSGNAMSKKKKDSEIMELLKPPENDNNNNKNPMVPVGMMPQYLAEAFGQVYEEDGMVVLGKGLGCLLLIASFVRFYADTQEGHLACIMENDNEAGNNTQTATDAHPSAVTRKQLPVTKPPLVFVFGLKENERKALITILQSWGTPPELLPAMITNESGHSSDRATLYQQGGVFCITSRILIVDLLTNVARANDIDGILVAHADQVTEQSTEAFILRIFLSQKQASTSLSNNLHQQSAAGAAGFVKAFTDAPDRLLSGFAKVDKVLKALHVRRLYLYPRFHESIRDELEEHPPTVTELHQALSATQQEMQSAIAAAVQACIRELKSSTKVLEWTDSELSVENCVTAHFDKAISRQLEHEWHKLRPATKQLVQDLRTLRTLFQSLIHYDCVSFLKLINSIKTMSAASRHPSMWLLTPAADLLFRKAKERVYRLVQPRPTAKTPNPMVQLEAVLEENPKWKLLEKVLAEVRHDYDEKKKKRLESEDDLEGPTNVLVMVKDEKTLEAVKNYLVDGKKRTLTLRWLRFLEQYNDRSRSISGNSTAGAASMSEESRLLLEEESRCRRVLFGQDAKRKQAQRKRSKLGGVPDYVKKRRRIATEKGRGELTHQTDDLEREAVLDDALEEAEQEMRATSYVANELGISKQADEEQDEAMFQPSNPDELRVILKSFTSAEGDEALLVLQDLQPRYVLFYDTEVSFIRAVEIYAALSTTGAQDPVQVYFLIFEASAEEKNFMKSLEREQNSFERLIQHKKTMPPPAMHMHASQEMQLAASQMGTTGASYMDGSLPLAFDSRTGKGKSNKSKERRDIAVDVREFRSALPSILHQGGMRLAPVTLTVGDFVLSSVHCVERKSISDLFGSFASGRLYTQAEAMCKYYKAPCLLIEFDPEKSFCLQNSNELGVEIRNDSICSKMALLTMHFPKLRILWSRSPHETLRIFSDLKANHEEVDVDKAVEIGRSESIEALLQPTITGKGNAGKDGNEDDDEDEINEAARDMLLRLPGVNIHAARRIMEEVDSLAELAEMSRDELRRVAGPVAGQKLFTFFHQKMGSV